MSRSGRPPAAGGSANTAYPADVAHGRAGAAEAHHGWHPVVNRLIERRHQFLACSFGEGVLFRGLGSGFHDTLAAGALAAAPAGAGVAAQEADLGVVLVSHVLADALAVARLWEAGAADAAVLVLDAGCFAAALAERRAGVLAFAEPGMVFRYPFLVPPVPLAAVLGAYVGPGAAEPPAGMLAGEPISARDRRGCESAIQASLERRGLAAAVPVAAGACPRRRR